jgi:hypothetical protein
MGAKLFHADGWTDMMKLKVYLVILRNTHKNDTQREPASEFGMMYY